MKKENTALRYSLLLFLALLFLFPLFWVLLTSFKTNIEVLTQKTFLPSSLSPENYQKAWAAANFGRQTINSLVVAISVGAAQVVTSALAGYALARIDFRGREGLMLLILSTIVIPFQVLAIPVFVIVRNLGWIDTYWALIIPTAANGFGIFLFRQFFSQIPIELEESALMDGVPRRTVLWRVIMPLCRPPAVTLFLFTFIAEWNDLFKPLIFTTSEKMRTIQLGLTVFQEQYMTNYPQLMAAVIFSMLPTVILFLIGQKRFTETIAATGIKG